MSRSASSSPFSENSAPDGRGLIENLPHVLQRQGARVALAVFEEPRRGRTCAHAASKLRQLLDGGVAIRYRLRLDAPEHEVAPRLRAVFRAPHRFRLPHRFWLADRVGKDVHGDVVELG